MRMRDKFLFIVILVMVYVAWLICAAELYFLCRADADLCLLTSGVVLFFFLMVFYPERRTRK